MALRLDLFAQGTPLLLIGAAEKDGDRAKHEEGRFPLREILAEFETQLSLIGLPASYGPGPRQLRKNLGEEGQAEGPHPASPLEEIPRRLHVFRLPRETVEADEGRALSPRGRSCVRDPHPGTHGR